MSDLSPATGSTSMLLVAAVGLGLVVVTTAPSVATSVRRLVSPAKASAGYSALNADLYEDEDGIATDESMRAFSDRLPRYAIAVLSPAGFAAALAAAILTTQQGPHAREIPDWLQVGVWVSD
jgi:hypothetical protein